MVDDLKGVADVVRKEINLLERHISVLEAVRDNGPIGIIRLSQITGDPQHMVRYSLRTLEESGLICPSPTGATLESGAEGRLHEMKKEIEKLINMLDSLRRRL